MENNKLNNLFDAARNADPIVSFEESVELLKQKEGALGGSALGGLAKFKYHFLSVMFLAVIAGGIYIINSKENKQAAQIDMQEQSNTTVEVPPATGAQPAEAIQAIQPAAETTTLNQANNTSTDEAASSTSTADVTLKPLKNKITLRETASQKNYVVETQTVNISNEEGKFKISFKGDQLEKIQLDNATISSENWSQYENVVAEAKAVLANMSLESNSSSNKLFVDYLFSSLKERKIISNNLATVKLNKDVLVIQGKTMSSELHEHLLLKYKDLTGNEIGNKTLYFN